MFITATLKTLPDTGQGVKAYDFLDERFGWVSTGLGWTERSPSALLSTQDGGKTWKLLANEVGHISKHLSFVSPQLGWRTYSWGKVQMTQDGGLTWSPVSLGTKDDCAIDLHFVDAQNGWVITCPDYLPQSNLPHSDLLRTQDGGKTWVALPEPPAPAPGTWWLVDFLTHDHGWTVFNNYRGPHKFTILVETLDGGQSWRTVYDSDQQTPESADFLRIVLYELSFADTLHGWIANGSEIYATQDGGASWQVIDDGTTQALYSGQRINSRLGFAIAGAGGPGRQALMKTLDGGQSWTQIYPPLFPLRELQFFDAQRGVGIGTAYDLGAILKTTDGGRSWKLFSSVSPHIHSAHKLSFADPQHGWVTVQDCPDQNDCGKKALYGTADGGRTWKRLLWGSITDDDLSFIDLVTSTTGYVLKGGQWLISRDAGQTFKPIAEMPDLLQVSFADAQNGWGLGRSSILATVDGGEHWQPIPFSLIIPKQLDYVSNGVGWATCENFPGAFWCQEIMLQTQDNGATWKVFRLPSIQYVEAIHFSTALDGWLRGGENTDSKGGYILGIDHLYITHDGGYTWEQVR